MEYCDKCNKRYEPNFGCDCPTGSKSAVDSVGCADGIVKALADWSKKYPRGRIYSDHVRKKMDGELVELEEAAKLLIYRGR